MEEGDSNGLMRVSALLLVAVLIIYIPLFLSSHSSKEMVKSMKDVVSSQSSSDNDPKIDSSGEKTIVPEDPITAEEDPYVEDDQEEDSNDEDEEVDEGDSNDEENNDTNSSGGGSFEDDIYSILTDFESGSISEHWNTQFARSDSGVIVSDIVRNGNYALKMNVRHGDYAVQHDALNDKSRVELSLKLPYADEYPMDGRPIFYGWSIYFPQDFYFNTSVERDNFNIVGQWFHRPDPGQSWEEWENNHGGKKGSPSVSIRYEELADGTTGLGILTRPNVNSQSTLIGEREIQLGQWNDIIFEIKWSMENDGYIQAWLNGGSFTDGKHTAKNMYTSTPKNLKLGLYRGPNVLSENTIYYDEIRIGGSYEDVDPNNF